MNLIGLLGRYLRSLGIWGRCDLRDHQNVITQKGHGMITTSSVSNFILKNIIKILIAKVIN